MDWRPFYFDMFFWYGLALRFLRFWLTLNFSWYGWGPNLFDMVGVYVSLGPCAYVSSFVCHASGGYVLLYTL